MDSVTIKPTFQFSGVVSARRISYTDSGRYPAISEYIAYDTLVPPNPFIAVTQDGLGRVVYDGGFPKFYNSQLTGSYPTFSSLPAACKYLHNAISWVMNPTKVAAGNRKVLVIGDATSGSNYPVGNPSASGFLNVFNILAPLLNVTFTLAPKDDTALVNFSYAQLNEYSAVIYMGTNASNVMPASNLTAAFVDNMVAYRAAGNGLIFITDHGRNLATIEEAATLSDQFFCDANRIIVNFGAWFTGTYNRTPVNVGFIRANYGDHPLYDGMTNDESIFAGGSESAVRIAADDSKQFAIADFPGFKVTDKNDGKVRALVEATDGTVALLSIDLAFPDATSGLFNNVPTVPNAEIYRNIDVRYTVNYGSSRTNINLGTFTYDQTNKTLNYVGSYPTYQQYWNFKLFL